MTCTRFSLNSRNRSASGALPQNPIGALPLDPAGGLPFLRSLLYVHPLVQFLNTQHRPIMLLNVINNTNMHDCVMCMSMYLCVCMYTYAYRRVGLCLFVHKTIYESTR